MSKQVSKSSIIMKLRLKVNSLKDPTRVSGDL